jgi:predicted RecB family endonuclease
VGRGSLAHEYWKRFYAAILREDGYRVELEAPRKGGRVDVLARKGTESIAVEIETGKSDVVWNVKQDLLSRFSQVLVVATDERALDKVEWQLAKAGLIIPKRINIVLRDQFPRPCAGSYLQ